jgi:Spy/CpxP family protein refolding chaperone
MNKKRIFIAVGAVVLLIMLVTGYGFVSASGPLGGVGWNCSPGFHGKGFHSKFHNRDFSEFIIWQMDREVQQLNLTSDQNAKYEEIKENLTAHLSGDTDDRRRLMEQFHTEMSKENPDVNYLIETLKTKLDEVYDFAYENLDLFSEFYDMLDSSQQQMLTGKIKERMEYHHSST